MELEKILNSKKEKNEILKPLFFDLKKEEDENKLLALFEKGGVVSFIDDYEEQQRELFAIQNPTKVYTQNFEEEFQHYYQSLSKKETALDHGVWVYFPWLSKLVHLLEEEDFFVVRTARNQKLITKEEQEKFYNSCVAIAGLSVGNSVALSIVLSGGSKKIKLADNDFLALSNLNRIRSGVEYLGIEKVKMCAEQIYLLNPYTEIEIFNEGLTEENIEDFLTDVDVVVDEMDHLAMKYLIREKSKEKKIPVLMATDCADTGIVDIERYDKEDSVVPFHGRMGELSYESLLNLDKFGIGKLATRHIGVENVTPSLMASMQALGKEIVSWPQLGGTATLNGPAMVYSMRRILNDQPLENNRAVISLDELLMPKEEFEKLKEMQKEFEQIFKEKFGE